MLKKRNLLFLSLLILGALLLTSCFLNPPVTEGILKGQILVPEGTLQAKDLTGQALPDATVNIIDPATGDIIATTTTDANGYYQVFVPAGGPYLLEAIKGGVKIQQFTPQVEVGIEYELGTADCATTAAALIAQAMLDAEDYPDDPADINLADISADPGFDDVMSDVCSTIEAGGDPTGSAAIQQAVEDFLHPPTPAPTIPSLSDAKAITAFDFIALDPDVVGVINEGAKNIILTVPFGTDVTVLVPTIVYTGVSVSPSSGAAQDFTSPVNYTVTAEDTSTQAYLVTVTVAAPVITTTSTIANGAATPIVTVTGTNFKTGIVAADLTVGVGTTGLTIGTVFFVSVTEITVAFTGTAAAGDLTIQAKTSAFDPTSVSVSNTLTVTVPAATIDIAVIPGVTAPVTGATPVTTITETAQYTGTVTWVPADNPFQGSTAYTATITLILKAGFTLTGVAANFFTVAGAVATNPIDSGVVTAVFPETAAAVINIAAIPGVTAPATGATPVTTITETTQYTGTVTWAPTDNPFQGEKVYTATITLTAKAGFTLTGVAANFFTVAGATIVTNTTDSGVVTAVFPETAAAVINIAAIPGVTAPATGATPVTTITETAQYTGTVTWNPADNPFLGGTAYTATITLTAKAGFTLTGVAANFFTVAEATTDTNPANSGVVTAVFPETVLAVGDSYGGGMVAYIFQSGDPGYDANVQHGLIAATADADDPMVWSNIMDTTVGTTGTAIGTGQANTTLIVYQNLCTGGAAYYCANLTEGSYADWFLPSKDELNKLYLNKGPIGGFAEYDFYFSSSESDAYNAWYQYFGDGLQDYYLKDTPIRVRAVRAF